MLVITAEKMDGMIAEARADCKKAKYKRSLPSHQARLSELLRLRAAMTEVSAESLEEMAGDWARACEVEGADIADSFIDRLLAHIKLNSR